MTLGAADPPDAVDVEDLHACVTPRRAPAPRRASAARARASAGTRADAHGRRGRPRARRATARPRPRGTSRARSRACRARARAGRVGTNAPTGRHVEGPRGPKERRAWLAPRGGNKTEARRSEPGHGPGHPAGQLPRDVPLVPSERLVPAVPRQRDGDMPARLFADEEGRKRRLVPE